MTIVTTRPTDIQERLSLAYLTAVAARAGCQILERKVDRNGIDATVVPIAGLAGSIDVQMKATCSDIRICDGKVISFQLDASTYDKLRREDVTSPQLLVVYEMPPEEDRWLTVDPTRSVLEHAAYWIDLYGRESIQTASTAIHIPAANLFDHRAIRMILERAHARARERLSWNGWDGRSSV